MSAEITVRPSRLTRVRATLSGTEWRRVGGMAFVIVALHAIGFGLLFLVIAPRGFRVGSEGVFGVGLGITAYTLGMRHAFDADHIAAIDNTTRKLMADGQRPLSVGFFFSLGHSSVVFLLALLFAFGLRSITGQVEASSSTLHQTTGIIGPLVSGSFLLLIGLFNLAILVSIVGVFRRMRRGDLDEAELREELVGGGIMTRVFGRATRTIRRPGQMYPLGFLFGLGFDTATEVALLFIAAGAALSGLPFYAILCLPILFAAGMSLLDTIDGAFMQFAYGWAFAAPVRRIYYNMTITGLSVFVALFVGGVELLAVFADRFHLTGGLWDVVAALDLNTLGYIVVALFVVTWLGAISFWRIAHVEERWSASLRR